MPEMNVPVVLYGITPCSKSNALLNHFLLIYKQILYIHRDRKSTYDLLPYFIRKVNEIITVERKIANNRNKLSAHKRKWQLFEE